MPSTTRAVAWGALFFSFLAFLMSAAALMFAWQDGRLARNAGQLMLDAREAFEKRKSAGDAAPAVEAEPVDSQRQNVTQQLDRYVQMIKNGDRSARFYLDGLKTEIEELRAKSKEHGGEWMAEASATIQKAREDLTTDAPEAARKLQELAKRLSTGEKSDAEDNEPGKGKEKERATGGESS